MKQQHHQGEINLDKADLADTCAALRRLGSIGLAYGDGQVQVVALTLLRLSRQRRLDEFLHEIGLIRIGGHSDSATAVLMKFRDHQIQLLYSNLCPRPGAWKAAKMILNWHKAYARNRLARDLARGHCVSVFPDQIFFEIARVKMRFPKSEDQICRIIKRLPQHPEGPLDAARPVVDDSP